MAIYIIHKLARRASCNQKRDSQSGEIERNKREWRSREN